jgi:flagellar protein FlaG
MNVDTISNPGGTTPQQLKPAEQIDSDRKRKDSVSSKAVQTPTENPKIQQEELLDQIKTVTQEGLYSVRFERGDNNDLVVIIFDNETQEVVCQIPAEELLNFKATFADLVGNVVNTKG